MKVIFLFAMAAVFVVSASSQNADDKAFKVVSYNVENLFDCVDDSLTNDAEFLPGGMRGWNYEKYQRKLNNIGRVITAIGGWNPPAVIGLCEIESCKCLYDLTRNSGLKNLNYKFVHHESPDLRGVDVALLYRPDKFKVLTERPLSIHFPDAPNSKTRDLLYVSGQVPTGDTLHVFVCHFPSRLGGELESEDKRLFVASVLRHAVDSIYKLDISPNILIMGDFNDYPDNESMKTVLGARVPDENTNPGFLYNMMYDFHKNGKGTHKQAGEWGALDQMIVSGTLLNTKNKFSLSLSDVHIFDAEFLLETDEKGLGKKPFRTYVGMKYNGGFADHLPVYADFKYQ